MLLLTISLFKSTENKKGNICGEICSSICLISIKKIRNPNAF